MVKLHFNGLVQEGRSSIANALELHLSCTDPLISSVEITLFWLIIAAWGLVSNFQCKGLFIISIFNRGQFWPSSPASVCVCVCPWVSLKLVHTITCDLFNIGSPNLNQRCKTPWLGSLLFWEAINLEPHCFTVSTLCVYWSKQLRVIWLLTSLLLD